VIKRQQGDDPAGSGTDQVAARPGRCPAMSWPVTAGGTITGVDENIQVSVHTLSGGCWSAWKS
jgi:hypothetical protein